VSESHPYRVAVSMFAASAVVDVFPPYFTSTLGTFVSVTKDVTHTFHMLL